MNFRSLPWLCAAAVLLSACDPAYGVGARQVLVGTRAMAPRKAPTVADSLLVPLDVEATGDCLETALRESPMRNGVTRSRSTGPLRRREARMRFSITDDSVPIHAYMNLTLEAYTETTPVLRIYTLWMGTARTYPIQHQRRLVSLARAALEEVSARCLPAVHAPVECFTEGMGGRAACTAGG